MDRHSDCKPTQACNLIRATDGLSDKNRGCFIWGLDRTSEDGTFKVSPEDEEEPAG